MHSPAFPKLMCSRCAPSITLWIPRPLQNSSNQPLYQGTETCRSIGESDQLLSLVCLSWVFCMLNLIIHGTSLVGGIARNLADGFKAVEPIPPSLSYFPVLLCQPLPPAPATMLWFGEDFSPLTLDMCGENPLEVSLSLCLRLGNNWFMCILGAQLTAILEGRWQYFGPDLLRLICESYTYTPRWPCVGFQLLEFEQAAWWRPCSFWRSALSPRRTAESFNTTLNVWAQPTSSWTSQRSEQAKRKEPRGPKTNGTEQLIEMGCREDNIWLG